MVKATPIRFNPDLLAREAVQYQAELPLAQFTRLADLLHEPAGGMQAVFRFSKRKKMVFIAGRLQANCTLLCQRCLEPMQYEIDEPFELVFAVDELAAKAMPEAYDPVILDENGQIHLVDLFEDELILHLPTVARHAESDGCKLQEFAYRDTKSDVAENSESEKRTPFDVLKNLDLN